MGGLAERCRSLSSPFSSARWRSSVAAVQRLLQQGRDPRARLREATPPIFALALFTAFLTAFYMMRLIVVAFFGKPRSEKAAHGSESPLVMTDSADHARDSSSARRVRIFRHAVSCLPPQKEPALPCPFWPSPPCSSASSVAVLLYRNRENDPLDISLFRERFYLDELYASLIDATQESARAISAFVDRWILDGAIVRGLERRALGHRLAAAVPAGRQLAGLAFLFGLGIIGLIYFTVFRLMLLFIVFCPPARGAAYPDRRTGAEDALRLGSERLSATLVAFFRLRSRPKADSSLSLRFRSATEWRLSFTLGVDGSA